MWVISTIPPPNSFMSGLKFIAGSISLITLFAAWCRGWWHATETGTNLCFFLCLHFWVVCYCTTAEKHRGCAKTFSDVIWQHATWWMTSTPDLWHTNLCGSQFTPQSQSNTHMTRAEECLRRSSSVVTVENHWGAARDTDSQRYEGFLRALTDERERPPPKKSGLAQRGRDGKRRRNNKNWVVEKEFEWAGHNLRDLRRLVKRSKWERGGIKVWWAVSDWSQGLWCPEIPGLCLVNWWVVYMLAVDKQIKHRAQRL